MKNSRSLLVILLIAAAALLAAWLPFDGAEQRSSAHGAVEVASPASKVAPATLSETRATDEDPEAADRSISVEGEVTRATKRTPAEQADARYKVRGVVVDQDEQPVQTSFRIFCTSLESSTSDKSEVFENTQGEFVVELPRAGDWFFHAVVEGYREESVASTVSVPQPAASQVELQVFGFPRIEGLIVDPSGQPMPNAKVKCRPQALLSDPLRTGPSVYSDQDGRFAIKVYQAGAGTIQATHEDWAASEAVEVELVPTWTLSGLVVALRTGGTIRGQAFERDGTLAGQHKIELEPWDKNTEPKEMTTDAEGKFVFEHITPGKYAIGMEYENDEPRTLAERKWDGLDWISRAATAMVEVQEGKTNHVKLGAPPPSPVILHGRVTQGGKPVRDMLMFIARGVLAPHALKAAVIAEDGTYEVTLNEAGVHQFIFMDADDDTVTEFAKSIPETARFELNISLPSGAIRGRVLERDGTPAKRVRVILARSDGYFSLQTWLDDISTRSDELGRFEFQGLKRGLYSLQTDNRRSGRDASAGIANRMGLVISKDEVLEGVELRLTAGCRLTGTVTNSAGKQLKKAAIFVRNERGQLLSNRALDWSDSSGRFTLKHLPAGEILVTARVGNLITTIPIRATVSEQAATELTLVLKPGTLLLIKGNGAPSFTLSVRDSAGNEHANMLGKPSFDKLTTQGFSSSERSIGPLAPGEYTVVATSDDGREVRRVVRLSGEPKQRLELRFR